MPQKNGAFEFRLGRFGLVFLTIVIALLLLFFFVCGVMVGKNIESYPKKIADMPGTIKEKIVKSRGAATGTDKKEDEIKFTFYDTLKGSGSNVKENFADKKVSSSEKYKPPEKKQRSGQYDIRVASFKDKGKTEILRAKLSDMGYFPSVDNVSLQSKGNWFRVKLVGFATYDDASKVASLVEKEIRGIRCLIIENRGN
ncbi:MAG: SPOR domain-containing protein [Deltaproteobacteria bacterium]|nr:SPOR domain-containing protein [Deltaproteobacteria bacterium]